MTEISTQEISNQEAPMEIQAFREEMEPTDKGEELAGQYYVTYTWGI